MVWAMIPTFPTSIATIRYCHREYLIHSSWNFRTSNAFLYVLAIIITYSHWLERIAIGLAQGHLQHSNLLWNLNLKWAECSDTGWLKILTKTDCTRAYFWINARVYIRMDPQVIINSKPIVWISLFHDFRGLLEQFNFHGSMRKIVGNWKLGAHYVMRFKYHIRALEG